MLFRSYRLELTSLPRKRSAREGELDVREGGAPPYVPVKVVESDRFGVVVERINA